MHERMSAMTNLKMMEGHHTTPCSQNHILTRFTPALLYKEVDGRGTNPRAKLQMGPRASSLSPQTNVTRVPRRAAPDTQILSSPIYMPVIDGEEAVL